MDRVTAYRDFLLFVLANLIQEPDQASIRLSEETAEQVVFSITLAQSDVGRLIGRNGFTISAVRSLLAAAGQKHGVQAKIRLYAQGQKKRLA